MLLKLYQSFDTGIDVLLYFRFYFVKISPKLPNVKRNLIIKRHKVGH